MSHYWIIPSMLNCTDQVMWCSYNIEKSCDVLYIDQVMWCSHNIENSCDVLCIDQVMWCSHNIEKSCDGLYIDQVMWCSHNIEKSCDVLHVYIHWVMWSPIYKVTSPLNEHLFRDLPNYFFNDGANSRNSMQSQFTIRLKVIKQWRLIYLWKFNDGARYFNNDAENLMMEHFNLTMEQLYHKIS